MIRNPNDSALEQRVLALETMLRANPLRSASIEEGRIRLIGGLFRVDSGGRVEIEGTLDGGGTLVWRGTLDQTGGTFLRGPVAITGEDGTLTVAAETLLQGLTTLLADLVVTPPGKIVAGNVTVESDKITIGTAPDAATLEDGEFKLQNGAKLAVGLTGGVSSIGLIPTGGSVDISANTAFAWMRAIGATISVSLSTVTLDAGNVRMPDLPEGLSTDGLKWLAVDDTGKIWKVAPGIGGPMGSGDFAWPFDPRPQADGGTVSNESGPDPLYDDGYHKGIDFAVSGGTPILAPASGTVLATAYDSERGNYIVVDHGTIGGYAITTRYYHLQSPSPLSDGDPVLKGSTELGLVGTTGLSTGNHLHWETRRDGAWMNPRTFMAIYGE